MARSETPCAGSGGVYRLTRENEGKVITKSENVFRVAA